MYDCLPALPCLYPCTLPTAPVSRSFGLRSSYEIDILDTDDFRRVLHFLLVTIAAVEKKQTLLLFELICTVHGDGYKCILHNSTTTWYRYQYLQCRTNAVYTHTEHKITFTY